MKVLITFYFIIGLISVTTFSQTWKGVINLKKNTDINYEIKLIKNENKSIVYFSSTELNAYEIQCKNTTYTKDSLNFNLVSDYYTYEYRLLNKDSVLYGELKIYGNESYSQLNTLTTRLRILNPIEKNEIQKSDYFFKSNDLQLYGSIWKPKKPNNRGILIVTSSQENDRSSSNSDANYFVNLGYFVFHYDKRGTGNSEGEWKTSSIEELCSDDINALMFFSEISGLNLSAIGIKGSSQGAIKIPYILSKKPEIGFGISISCPDGTLLESDLNYWKNLTRNQIGKKNFKQATILQKSVYEFIAGNITKNDLNKILNPFKNEKWFKYVWIPNKTIQKDKKLNFIGLPYFSKIKQPILIIQGLSDNIIPIKSYKTIKTELKKSQSKNHKIITLKNTTHEMTIVNSQHIYFQILSSEYLESIKNWLEKIES